MSLENFLQSLSLDFIPELDGEFHEFDSSERGRGWYVGSQMGNVSLLTLGLWKSGEKYTYRPENAPEDDLKTFKAKAYLKRIANSEANEKASEAINSLLAESSPAIPTPYSINKKIDVKNLYMHRSFPHALLVPLQDLSGRVWSLQAIKPSAEKSFTEGGKLEGMFYLDYGDIATCEIVLISEGLATCKTVTGLASRLSNSYASVAAMTAYNIPNIAYLFKHKTVYICADNDHETEMTRDFNPGLDKAEESFHHSILTPPPLKDVTDWNDYYSLSPLEASQEFERQFKAPSHSAHRLVNQESGVSTQTTPKPAKASPIEKKSKPPTQLTLANALLQSYQDKDIDLACYGSELFIWSKTHWEPIHLREQCPRAKRLFKDLMRLGVESNTALLGVAELVVKLAQTMPVNPYKLNNHKYNFTDGTLHYNQRTHTVELHPHRKEDFLLDPPVIPYDTSELPESGILRDSIKRVISQAEIPEESEREIYQMFGTAIMPAFPQGYFLLGESGSGKTTLLKSLTKLLGGNIDSTNEHLPRKFATHNPSEWGGAFGKTLLMGKLYNVCGEMAKNSIFPEADFKRMLDGDEMTVDRKFMRPVTAILPRVHYYAGNALPRSLENTHSLDRRITIVKCDAVISGTDKDILNFHELVWDKDRGGLVNIAKEGLRDILKGQGKLYKSKESKRLVHFWTNSENIGEALRRAIELNEFPELTLDPESKIKRGEIWDKVRFWCEDYYGKNMGKKQFYAEIRSEFKELHTEYGDYFLGIKLQNDGVRQNTQRGEF